MRKEKALLQWAEQRLADYLADSLASSPELHSHLAVEVTFRRADVAYAEFLFWDSMPKPLDPDYLDEVKRKLTHNENCVCGRVDWSDSNWKILA